MPSIAYQIWDIDRAGRLDDVETAHSAVRGPAAVRRIATRQLNHAYTVLLAAEFQGFCRELHTEATRAVVAALSLQYRNVLAIEFAFGRQLDRGNANPTTLRTDFNRFGIDLWAAVDAIDARGPLLRRLMEELKAWRNVIAHSDFDPLGWVVE